jgi:hypothetical protein
MVEIDQLTGHQIERHGIDREIPASEVSIEGAGSHDGILGWRGVVLLSRCSQIKRNPIQLKCHRSECTMLLDTADAFRAHLSDQFRHQSSGITLDHPVQIRDTRPRAAATLMQQLITDNAADQGQTTNIE